jgi:hypothetical protein
MYPRRIEKRRKEKKRKEKTNSQRHEKYYIRAAGS